MSKKIALDAGHSISTPGKQTPKGVKEWTLNNAVCRHIAAILVGYDAEVVRIDDTTGKTDTDLNKRTNKVNSINPDLCISVHHNANTGGWGTWTGVEVFHNEHKPKRDADLAKLFANEVSRLTGLRNRGAKSDIHSPEKSLAMVRATKSTIPSVLIEGGFMDSLTDEPVITSEKGQKSYAQAVANVCISYLGLKKRAYTGTPISGRATITAETMAAFLLSRNPSPKAGCTALELARHYISEGNAEDIRGDIAFCQAIQETGWFKFGNDVLPEQNNYCGLGATNTTAKGKGAWLATPQVGVRAHIQHLKAYANTAALCNVCVDPRFGYVTRGIAPNWTDLDGRWAVPGVGYGAKILSLYADLCAFKAPAATKYYKVQVGAYAGISNANSMLNRVKTAGFGDSCITIGTDKLHRVQLGAFTSKANADALLAKVKAAGFDAFVKFE